MVDTVTQDGFPTIEEAEKLGPAEELVSLENLIKTDIAESENVTKEIKHHKEMIDNVLGNNETYVSHTERAKEALRIKANTKKEILKQPDVAHIAEKLKELRQKKKEIKEELSNYGAEYMRIGKQMALDFGNGQEYEIVQEIQIVKRIKM